MRRARPDFWRCSSRHRRDRDSQRLHTAAEHGAQTVALIGDRQSNAAALRTAPNGDAPSIVLDFVWGDPAEAAFEALARTGFAEDTADTSYVGIGSLAGANASALSRGRGVGIRVECRHARGDCAGLTPAAAQK